MGSFNWDKNFETGIEDVDEQHQYLVTFINQYGDLISDNTVEMTHVRSALFELNRYAEYHFIEEETLMREQGLDPRHIEEHIKLHRAFMHDVVSMQAFINETDLTSAEQLLNFLIHWLAYHILGMDKTMAKQIERIQQGMSPDDAYQKEQAKSDSSTQPLLDALNGLFEQVSDRNKALLELNQCLEQKVEERTRELTLANKKLEHLSLTDSLTQLPNRRFAMKNLELLWNESEATQNALSCIMVDVDHFKSVNDTHGHDAGDQVLIELSRALKHSFRNDDLVCRLGGDEFLIICPNTEIGGAHKVATQTLDTVRKLSVPTGSDYWIGSISVGIAEKTNEMQTFNDLMKAADQAVYFAKTSGRNRIYVQGYELAV